MEAARESTSPQPNRSLQPSTRIVLRTVTALVGLPILIGAVWVGYPWLTVLVVAVALLGWREYHNMWSGSADRLALAFGALWTALLVLSGQLTYRLGDGTPPLLSYLVLGGGVLVALPWAAWGHSGGGTLRRLRLATGPIYLGFLLAHAVALWGVGNGSAEGRDWLLFALLATMGTDTGAFVIGRALGRRLIAPTISPGKTWEGALGGFLSGAGCGVAIAALLGLPLTEATGLGLAVGVLAQLGDLAESRLKRAAGVKEAGSLLPGHGGVLDRLDSIVFAIPVVYYLVILVVKP